MCVSIHISVMYECTIDWRICVFIGNRMLVITYVDECLIFSPSGSYVADNLITSLQEGHENFSFTDQGPISTYLGMDIKYEKDQITMTQPHLIQRFMNLIGI